MGSTQATETVAGNGRVVDGVKVGRKIANKLTPPPWGGLGGGGGGGGKIASKRTPPT